MTVGLGLVFATFIPNTPKNIRWLDDRERAQLQYRLEIDRATKDASEEISVWKAFVLAATDPKTWLMCSVLFVSLMPPT